MFLLHIYLRKVSEDERVPDFWNEHRLKANWNAKLQTGMFDSV